MGASGAGKFRVRARNDVPRARFTATVATAVNSSVLSIARQPVCNYWGMLLRLLLFAACAAALTAQEVGAPVFTSVTGAWHLSAPARVK